MFTGLVLCQGALVAKRSRGELLELVVESERIAGALSPGASVAIAGVCLTATGIAPPQFSLDVADETLRRTKLGELRPGDAVNLELPLRADDRLGGHFVQGHVDGLGQILMAGNRGADWVLRVRYPNEGRPYVVEKGSIAVDGVSLTVCECGDDWFELMLIPHTLSITTLGGLQPGDSVNLEYDILAKYMARIAEPYLPRP